MLRCPARLLAICLCASLLTGACQFGAWNIQTQPPTPLAPFIPFAPASAARSAVLDDFEDTSTSWSAGAWPYFNDSSATRATPSTLHATRGSQSLQLSYILGTQPKAIFYLDRELSLGLSQTIA